MQVQTTERSGKNLDQVWNFYFGKRGKHPAIYAHYMEYTRCIQPNGTCCITWIEIELFEYGFLFLNVYRRYYFCRCGCGLAWLHIGREVFGDEQKTMMNPSPVTPCIFMRSLCLSLRAASWTSVCMVMSGAKASGGEAFRSPRWRWWKNVLVKKRGTKKALARKLFPCCQTGVCVSVWALCTGLVPVIAAGRLLSHGFGLSHWALLGWTGGWRRAAVLWNINRIVGGIALAHRQILSRPSRQIVQYGKNEIPTPLGSAIAITEIPKIPQIAHLLQEARWEWLCFQPAWSAARSRCARAPRCTGRWRLRYGHPL